MEVVQGFSLEELEQVRRYLAEREEEQRRARKKERRKVITEVRKVLKDVAPKYGITKAYLYGSFLTGNQRFYSDVDLAVEGKFSFSDLLRAQAELDRKLSHRPDLRELKCLPFQDRIRKEGLVVYVNKDQVPSGIA
ncbi:MAG: nucleotidyltransferase domain-containing protein [Syntrophothermus sp.]|uniref:nucleotidyltransferase family protein n=1 Tax=Syntrophothermus sp. TaxID=2736299 RepID=UPI00257C6355|nr:nucleotidyltransferase domain-containing protein [Syntrophothermus sp.]NSW84345.1 nucleotidyltransferase domain-containing protein [Syntrophothermus sp.]